MREYQKNISLEVDGTQRSFKIRKMDAFAGAALLRLVLRAEEAAPADRGSIDLLQFLLSDLDEQELRSVMTSALNHTEVLLDAGYQPVMQQHEWAWEDARNDTATCLRLTVEVCAYSLEGFFHASGSPAQTAPAPQPAPSPSPVPTSTNSPFCP